MAAPRPPPVAHQPPEMASCALPRLPRAVAAPRPPAPTPLPARRAALLAGVALLASKSATAMPGFKKDLKNRSKKRREPLPLSAYEGDAGQGLKFHDYVVGPGQEAHQGDRVVVHYEARWRGVTFMTSRVGPGVTGGTPLGFDVGAKPGAGGTLAGLNLGVLGMRVGGQRRLLVPPELAYGATGVGEVPGGATLEFEVELLSIKGSPLGFRTKLVEG